MVRHLIFLDGKSQHCKDVNSPQIQRNLLKSQPNFMELNAGNLNTPGREREQE